MRRVSSRADQERMLAVVLEARAVVLRENRLPEDETNVVPWRLQQTITTRLKTSWWDQKTQEQKHALLDPCKSKDAMQRAKDSYFRAMLPCPPRLWTYVTLL